MGDEWLLWGGGHRLLHDRGEGLLLNLTRSSRWFIFEENLLDGLLKLGRLHCLGCVESFDDFAGGLPCLRSPVARHVDQTDDLIEVKL